MRTVRVIRIDSKRGMISPLTPCVEELMMRSDLTLYAVSCVFFLVLVLSFVRFWRGGQPAPTAPKPPRRKREPKPFAGYTRKPECELCDHSMDSRPQAPTAPPPRMMFTRGRRRHIDTTGHFCPQATCSYHGWVDWGNIRRAPRSLLPLFSARGLCR